MSEPLLKIRALKKYFPVRRGFLAKPTAWVKAVDGVSFDIQQGEILGLVGESGCMPFVEEGPDLILKESCA